MRGTKTKRGPGRYRLRVYAGRDALTGKPLSYSKEFKGSDKDADTELARFVAKVTEGREGGSNTTVASLLDRFIEHSERIGRSPATVHEYRRMAAILKDGAIGKLALRKLTPDNLDALYGRLAKSGTGTERSKGGLSAASINRYHDLLRASLAWAVKRGWIDRSPADRATAPIERRAEIAAPTLLEVRALLAAAVKRDPAKGVLLFLAATTGCRRGELCALRRSDLEVVVDPEVGIDVPIGVLHVRHAVKKSGPRNYTIGDTKTHQERSIAIDAGAVALVQAYIESCDRLAEASDVDVAPDPFLFSPRADYSRPYDPDTVTQFTSRLMRDLGTPYHLHQLRHFAATQLIHAKQSPKAVSRRLGHSTVGITMDIYTKALSEADREAADVLGERVGTISLPPIRDESSDHPKELSHGPS